MQGLGFPSLCVHCIRPSVHACDSKVGQAMNYLFEQAVPLGRNKTRDQSGFVWFVGFVALLPSV